MKNKIQESETSTFGMKEFRNIHTDQFQKPVLNDYTPTGAVSMSTKDYVGNPPPEPEDRTIIKAYIRIFKEPEESGTYFTDHGFLKYANGKWTDHNRMGYNGIECYYQEVTLTQNQLKCLEGSL